MARYDPSAFYGFLFHDAVRLPELFSAFNLIAWSFSMAWNPDLFLRDTYSSFSLFSPKFWSVLFGLVGVVQFVALFMRPTRRRVFRSAAMVLAAGCWSLVAYSFFAAGVGTTANANYALLMIVCFVSGAYLAWKET